MTTTKNAAKAVGNAVNTISSGVRSIFDKAVDAALPAIFEGVRAINRVIEKPLSDISNFVQENKDVIMMEAASITSIAAGAVMRPKNSAPIIWSGRCYV